MNMHRFDINRRLAVILVLVSAAPSWGQTPAGAAPSPTSQDVPTAQTHPNNPEMWNVDKMMEDAGLQISRRYNLNPAQENYTKLLLRKRVTAFLEQYETDVRELLKESIDLRLGLKSGGIEAYKKWATRAVPIYKAAKDAILEGNEEWRQILNPDQLKIHDMDLALMKTNFEQVTRVMSDWEAGKGPAGPGAIAGANATPQANQAMQAAMVSKSQAPIVRSMIEDSWEAYTNHFIKTYKLDEKQKNAAKEGILKEYRTEATKYRDRRKAEFDELDQQIRNPKPKWNPIEVARRRAEMEKPIRRMFVSLDGRLQQLPDSKQRAAADATERTSLEAMFKMLSSDPGEKLPQREPAKDKPSEMSAEKDEKSKTESPAKQPTSGPNEKK
jgi:hypothetical protein